MTNTFFWADLHLGHRFVAGLRGLEPKEHDQRIVDAWEQHIGANDVIYLLGDISTGSARGTRYALDVISRLPGRKRLIAGNHDPVHPMHRQSLTRNAPWWEVFEDIQPYAVKKINGQKFMLSHFPYSGDHTAEERYTQYRLPDCGLPLVHGHVHDLWLTNGNQYNVGVDHHPAPVPLNVIEDWVNNPRPGIWYTQN